MRATMAQKILARAAGKDCVQPGDIVEIEPDLTFTHDHQGPMTIREFTNIGHPKVWNPDKICMFMDHRTPSQTEVAAANHKIMREFAHAQGIKAVHDVGTGICHDQIMEQRLARPGNVVIGNDSHTTTMGAVAAFGTGVGSSEVASMWARGKLWLRVPESIRVELTGTPPPDINGKDIALAILGMIGTDGATYQSMEFHGEGAAALGMDDRMCICNMCLEMGAKAALFAVDDITRAFFRESGIGAVEEVRPDPHAMYKQTISLDLTGFRHRVALPHSPANVVTALEAEKETIPLNQALIGTCTNGRIRDLRQAAEVLKGRKVHPSVRTLIVPATHKLLKQALDEGLVKIFLDAGAMVGVPACGPCGAYGMGAVADGEYCVTTGSRNFVARLGSAHANVFLAAPATVAASAVAGRIISPETLAKEDAS